MKTISTFINVCIIAAFTIFTPNSVNAQAACLSPRLQFSNPTLVSGTPLLEGAIYKFPNVTAGIDCFIKVKKFNGGATLVAMETPGQGYPDAWQPIVKGPGAPVLNRSWIDFEVSFKTTAGVDYGFPCLDISSIDIDGDNGKIGEYVEYDGHTSYDIPDPTLLAITNLGNGKIRAQGPSANRPSIDTSAFDVRASFYFNGRDKIDISLGSYVYNNGYTGAAATERLNCVYFKKITGTFMLLPLKFLSFNANPANNKVLLDWATENEINNNHFEVERSFDNNNFKTIGSVASQAIKNYKYIDHSNELKGKKLAYYRLKQVDNDHKVTYSNVIAVKLRSEEVAMSMQVGPNPFVDKLNIGFDAAQNGAAELRISNITGKLVSTKKYNVNNGYNNFQLTGLGSLAPGMYMVQLFVNGVALETKKLIKD